MAHGSAGASGLHFADVLVLHPDLLPTAQLDLGLELVDVDRLQPGHVSLVRPLEDLHAATD